MHLVPAKAREQEVPCRFTPLNDRGQTVDSLYRAGTQQEMEEALRDWLRREISRLESKQNEPAAWPRSKPETGSLSYQE